MRVVEVGGLRCFPSCYVYGVIRFGHCHVVLAVIGTTLFLSYLFLFLLGTTPTQISENLLPLDSLSTPPILSPFLEPTHLLLFFMLSPPPLYLFHPLLFLTLSSFYYNLITSHLLNSFYLFKKLTSHYIIPLTFVFQVQILNLLIVSFHLSTIKKCK